MYIKTTTWTCDNFLYMWQLLVDVTHSCNNLFYMYWLCNWNNFRDCFYKTFHLRHFELFAIPTANIWQPSLLTFSGGSCRREIRRREHNDNEKKRKEQIKACICRMGDLLPQNYKTSERHVSMNICLVLLWQLIISTAAIFYLFLAYKLEFLAKLFWKFQCSYRHHC